MSETDPCRTGPRSVVMVSTRRISDAHGRGRGRYSPERRRAEDGLLSIVGGPHKEVSVRPERVRVTATCDGWYQPAGAGHAVSPSPSWSADHPGSKRHFNGSVTRAVATVKTTSSVTYSKRAGGRIPSSEDPKLGDIWLK